MGMGIARFSSSNFHVILNQSITKKDNTMSNTNQKLAQELHKAFKHFCEEHLPKGFVVPTIKDELQLSVEFSEGTNEFRVMLAAFHVSANLLTKKHLTKPELKLAIQDAFYNFSGGTCNVDLESIDNLYNTRYSLHVLGIEESTCLKLFSENFPSTEEDTALVFDNEIEVSGSTFALHAEFSEGTLSIDIDPMLDGMYIATKNFRCFGDLGDTFEIKLEPINIEDLLISGLRNTSEELQIATMEFLQKKAKKLAKTKNKCKHSKDGG